MLEDESHLARVIEERRMGSAPEALLRFLFLRPRPNRAIEFDPTGDTMAPA